MLRFLPSPVRGTINLVLLILNTLWWCTPLFIASLVKLLLPFAAVRRVIDPLLNTIAGRWIAGNGLWMRLVQRSDWDVAGLERFSRDGWYLVTCNHQSWADIFVLQRLLNGRIPMLKFFLKQELIWVPVIGLAWWALDFPFMRRHGDKALLKHPEKRLDDIEATRRACAKFALVPTSVMNFVEGTRFTPAKHAAQRSTFRHLLKPKAGGLALALSALGERFDSHADFTIVYPDGVPTFWHFLCGDVGRIIVRAERRPIPIEFCHGDYAGDPKFRKSLQRWLLAMWREKDETIDALLQGRAPAARRAAIDVASIRPHTRPQLAEPTRPSVE